MRVFVVLPALLLSCSGVSDVECHHSHAAREDRPLRERVDKVLQEPEARRLEAFLALHQALPDAPGWTPRAPEVCPHTPPHGGDLIYELLIRAELKLLRDAMATERLKYHTDQQALYALADRRDPETFPILVARFKPRRPLPETFLRVAMANGISCYLSEPAFAREAMDLLTFHLLLDPDAGVRAWTAFALADSDDPEALRWLESSMEWDAASCEGPSCKLRHRVKDHSRMAVDRIRSRKAR